jgi:hypothetical protein
MRRLLLIALPVLAIAFAACGDDDGDTTSTETVPESIAPEATASEESPAGPSGALTQTGVGEVEQGATVDEVTGLFGPPAEELTAPGCELAGPEAPESLIQTYELGDGELALTFNADTRVLDSYRSTTPDLETDKGDVVGDPFSAVRSNWGAELKPLLIGRDEPSETMGLWVVKGAAGAQLLFDIRGGDVASISGGDIQICE